jgi:hypothetical protein
VTERNEIEEKVEKKWSEGELKGKIKKCRTKDEWKETRKKEN